MKLCTHTHTHMNIHTHVCVSAPGSAHKSPKYLGISWVRVVSFCFNEVILNGFLDSFKMGACHQEV